MLITVTPTIAHKWWWHKTTGWRFGSSEIYWQKQHENMLRKGEKFQAN